MTQDVSFLRGNQLVLLLHPKDVFRHSSFPFNHLVFYFRFGSGHIIRAHKINFMGVP